MLRIPKRHTFRHKKTKPNNFLVLAGLIRKGTAYELLEAQAACGKIVDVQTGRVLSVETASKV